MSRKCSVLGSQVSSHIVQQRLTHTEHTIFIFNCFSSKPQISLLFNKAVSSPFQWRNCPLCTLMASLTRASSVILLVILLTWTPCLAKGAASSTSSRQGASSTRSRRPNIVFVLADDLGWNEVPWHNSHLRYGLDFWMVVM